MTEDTPYMVKHLLKSYPDADEAALTDFVIEHFKEEKIKKKSLVFMNGQANTRHYYVEKGLLRLYILDISGKEFNLLFAKEGQVIGDLATPSPTLYNLGTVEDAIVHSIDNVQLAILNEEVLHSSSLGLIDTIRRSYSFLQKRLVSILSQTAEENYLDLRDNYPDMLQRLPQYHIASYLGVSAEFLSKIIARTTKPLS